MPRTNFCWLCGRKLWGNHYTEINIDGHSRILHKSCAKDGEKSLSMYYAKYHEKAREEADSENLP